MADYHFATTITTGRSDVSVEGFIRARDEFLTSDDFHCRQPIAWRLFQSAGLEGRVANPCDTSLPIQLNSADASVDIRHIDPRRIRSVHLLFAGKSPAFASRYGHAALRLVVCPEIESTDATCDANLFEHVVLGFQAHVDELGINVLDAINGGYRAYLFANPFMDVYRKYAIHEFRELYSVPFQLDDLERERVVRELVEIHWRHGGEYRFFSRNCATLLQDSLKLIMPDFQEQKVWGKNYLRPDRYFSALQNSEVIDHGKLHSLELAEQQGFYFSSTKPFYEKAFYYVRDALSLTPIKTLEDFLKIPPQQVRSWYEQESLIAMMANDDDLKQASLLLEEYRVFSSERWMMIETVKFLESIGLTEFSSAQQLQLNTSELEVFNQCMVNEIAAIINPKEIFHEIPLRDSENALLANKVGCKDQTRRELVAQVLKNLSDKNPKQWQRIQLSAQMWSDSINNIYFLNQSNNREI